MKYKWHIDFCSFRRWRVINNPLSSCKKGSHHTTNDGYYPEGVKWITDGGNAATATNYNWGL